MAYYDHITMIRLGLGRWAPGGKYEPRGRCQIRRPREKRSRVLRMRWKERLKAVGRGTNRRA